MMVVLVEFVCHVTVQVTVSARARNMFLSCNFLSAFCLIIVFKPLVFLFYIVLLFFSLVGTVEPSSVRVDL